MHCNTRRRHAHHTASLTLSRSQAVRSSGVIPSSLLSDMIMRGTGRLPRANGKEITASLWWLRHETFALVAFMRPRQLQILRIFKARVMSVRRRPKVLRTVGHEIAGAHGYGCECEGNVQGMDT